MTTYLNSSLITTNRTNLQLIIKEGEFVNQNEIENTMNLINSISFETISFKLEKEYMWSSEATCRALVLYKQWLALQKYYPNLSFAPSELVDEYWHMHILDTRKYMEDCALIFGEYLHHYPYFGLTEVENQDTLKEGFELTKKLYLHHFNHSNLGMHDYKSAACGCRSGNGGSCR